MGFPIEAGIDQTNRRADAHDSHSGIEPQADRADAALHSVGVAVGLAVAGGCGYVPIAPGTAGSLLGAVLFASIVCAFSATVGTGLALAATLVVGTLALFAVGVWASGVAERAFGRADDGRIVIDEVVGQWITLLPLLLFVPRWFEGFVAPGRVGGGLLGASDGILSFFFWVVTGFVLFRLFDVWKPGVIRWTERRSKGGFGVMIDDVAAGIHGAAVLFALVWLGGAGFPGTVFSGTIFSGTGLEEIVS